MPTALAFENVAAGYDEQFGENPIARLMRETVWRELFSRLPAPTSVLDLGCGTGIDACEIAARGHQVLAADGAQAMLQKVEEKRGSRAVKLIHVELNDAAARKDLWSRADVDAVLANFGVLNCVEDLDAFAAELADRLLPGGLVVAVVMGKLCPWEIGFHLLRFEPRRAVERLRAGPVPVLVGGHAVPVRYYQPGGFCRRFSPWFRTLSVRGIGSFLPPPYLARHFSAWPELVARLARWEERWGGRWPARLLGDHFLAVLERK